MLSASTGVDTQTIFDHLGVEPEVLSSDICIDLELPAELCEVLVDIKNPLLFQRKKRVRRGLRYQYYVTNDASAYFQASCKSPRQVSIKYLICILETLNFNEEIIAQLPEKQLAALEEYRLAIMQAVYKKLEEKLADGRTIPMKEDDGTRIYNFFKKYLPRVLYGFCIFIFTGGIILDILYNFSGFLEIFQMAAFISPPVAIGLAIGFTLLNLILYVAFEGRMLAEMFDIRPKADEKKKIDAWSKQMDLTAKIRGLVFNEQVNPVTDQNYRAYQSFLSCCNNTIKYRKDFFTDCNETPARTWLRRVLTGVGALLTVGGAVFGGMSLISMLCKVAFFACIFANPVAAGIFVGVIVLIAFVSYFATAGKGIGSLVSPNLAEKKELRQALEDKALVPQLKPQYKKEPAVSEQVQPSIAATPEIQPSVEDSGISFSPSALT